MQSMLYKYNYSKTFIGSENYWINRYDSGRTSGNGSYGKLAEFKAEIINEFVLQNSIEQVIEYGCGDGNQLKLANYPFYIGFDISFKAILICKSLFAKNARKTFKLMSEYTQEQGDLTLSLDVIYHLVEEQVFFTYMNRLFDSSKRYVIVYSSNTEIKLEYQASHVKHRNFSKWVFNVKPEWKLIRHIPNKYPFIGNTKTGSLADFFVYEKA
ncbi:hypothetical protein [Microcoleus sp. D3_18_C4]|uniref:hypothetical protein n=1 Tax=Microcoleus sp. D3_18_C4 TaxID=3055335 RepID=UPI002FD45B65